MKEAEKNKTITDIPLTSSPSEQMQVDHPVTAGRLGEGALQDQLKRLFCGKMESYIKCVNVDYESRRGEEFWDLQLNVKGFKNLRESFEDLVAVEMMDGDNQYRAEGYGLQDARKGVAFLTFPPVLHMQLKRFEYDFNRDAIVKVPFFLSVINFRSTIDMNFRWKSIYRIFSLLQRINHFRIITNCMVY